MTSKHKSPSRIKYEERKPVFSVRMPIEWHDALKLYLQKTNRSRETFMGLALNQITENYEEVYKKGFNDGEVEGHKNGLNYGKILGKQEGYDEVYDKGKNDWIIRVPCCTCGEPVDIIPNSKEHLKIKIELRRSFFCQRCLPYNP